MMLKSDRVNDEVGTDFDIIYHFEDGVDGSPDKFTIGLG